MEMYEDFFCDEEHMESVLDDSLLSEEEREALNAFEEE